MKRGLTIIEMLASLVLLSMLGMALVGWIQATAHSSAECVEPVRWRNAANAVLQLIHDDVVTGDFELTEPGKRGTSHRVTVQENRLIIQTRSRGSVVHFYSLDSNQGALQLKQSYPNGEAKIKLLLEAVKEFECDLDEESCMLHVKIQPVAGREIVRNYKLS